MYLLDTNKKCQIIIDINNDSLTLSGQNTFSEGKDIRISCFGKVACWDPLNYILEITPIAIY
jgi:hypothetical protein